MAPDSWMILLMMSVYSCPFSPRGWKVIDSALTLARLPAVSTPCGVPSCPFAIASTAPAAPPTMVPYAPPVNALPSDSAASPAPNIVSSTSVLSMPFGGAGKRAR